MKSIPNSIGLYEELFRRSLLFASLYVLIVTISMTPVVVSDPDIGWHLSAGQWMVKHGTALTTDPFSLYTQGKPWVAYSWLFELILYGLVQVFGLVGLLVYTVALALGITSALFMLIRKIEQNASIVIGLTALGIFGMAPLLQTPRPWLFNILLFIIELDILLTVRRTGNTRHLLLLPCLFALWTNLHIQFIYGLFALGAFLIEPFIEQSLRRPFSFDNVKSAFNIRLWLIAIACFVATLTTPYAIHLYGTIIFIIRSGVYHYVAELQAMSFRGLPDWIVLGLTVCAAHLLGQKAEARPFPVIMLMTGIFLSFRSARDVWFVVLTAIFIIASSHPPPSIGNRFKIRKTQMLLAAFIVGLVVILLVRKHKLTEEGLTDAMAKSFPTAAVEVVKTRGYSGPLYNHYDWGGYPRLSHKNFTCLSMDSKSEIESANCSIVA